MMSLGDAVLALSLTVAVAHGLTVTSQPSYGRMVTKTMSVSLLSILSAIRGRPRLLVVAEVLSATGDAFLAWEGETAFLCGLTSFLGSHILYITLFSQNGGGNARLLSETRRIVAAGVMALLTPTMVVTLVPRVGQDLRVPILVYSTAIFIMVLAALTMDDEIVVLGAIIFTASDTILAAEKFLVSVTSPHRVWMQYAVWVLYYLGQLCIMLGSV